MTENPFRPPSSELLTEAPQAVGGLIQGGRVLPASRGAVWFREGLRMTMRAPLQWLVVLVMFVLITLAISIIPIVSMLSSILMPVLLGGVMLGCHTLAHGGRLELSHLFKGFELSRRSALLMVGVLYLAGSTLLIIGGVIIGLGGLVAIQMAIGADALEAQPFFVGGLGIVVLLAVALAATVFGSSVWFAPALVALGGMPAFDAMRLSVSATLRNVLPFLVFGLILLGVNLVAWVLIGAIVGIPLAVFLPEMAGPASGVAVVVGAVLVLIAMLPSIWSAMYVSYRDVFIP